MAEIIWTEPAIADLEEIADHIALDNPEAALALVRRVFKHLEQLVSNQESGSIPPELRPSKTYRQIVEAPCRVFYRTRGDQIFIVHVMRGERLLRRTKLRR